MDKHLRHMEVHRLITLAVSTRLNKARAATLDLHSAAGLLLDVLHISTALPNNLSSQVETRDRLKINGNTLIWPFALHIISSSV